MTQKTTLAESIDYRITLHEGDRRKDPLIVTFAGQPGQLADQGFGTDFVLSRGYDTVYVGQRYESHFQGLDLATFQAALAPVAEGRRVVCYGSSLGAYAALYFGGSIEASILAGAPMLPSWTGFDRPNYRNLERHHVSLTDVPKNEANTVILTDPNEPPDIKYIEGAIRPAFPDARYVEYPYAGHTVLKTLDLAGSLADVVLQFFDSGTVPNIELPTEGFVPWHINFGNAMMRKRDFDAALANGRKAFAISRDSSSVSLIMRAMNGLELINELADFVSAELNTDERTKFVENIPVLKRLYEKALANS